MTKKSWKWSTTLIPLKMEDDLHFLKTEYDLNSFFFRWKGICFWKRKTTFFLKWNMTSLFWKMEDDLKLFPEMKMTSLFFWTTSTKNNATTNNLKWNQWLWHRSGLPSVTNKMKLMKIMYFNLKKTYLFVSNVDKCLEQNPLNLSYRVHVWMVHNTYWTGCVM